MLVAVLMVLAVLSVASRSAVGPIVQAALVLGTAVAFASTLLLISDLDHPYAGPCTVTRPRPSSSSIRSQPRCEARCRAIPLGSRPTPPAFAQPLLHSADQGVAALDEKRYCPLA